MRKWIRIPVAVLVLLAIVLVPRNETEVHKRRCQAAWDRLHGKSITERIKGVYYKVTKTFRWSDNYGELSSSREALVELGYLAQQDIALTNLSANEMEEAFIKTDLHSSLTWVRTQWGKVVTITAPKSEILTVSNAVRRIDATGK